MTTVQEHTLDLARDGGHGLVATVRMLRPTVRASDGSPAPQLLES